MKWIVKILLLTVFTACGNKDDITKSLAPSGGGGSSDLTRSLDCRSSALRGSLGSDEDPRDVTRAVPASELSVHVDGEIQNICDIMKFSEKKLLLMQFVDYRCYPCLRWAEANTADLKADAKGEDVLSMVVVVNTPSELSDEGMNQLREDVAPDAIWGRDRARLLWNFFAESSAPDSDVTPLTIVMDPFGRAFYEDDWKTKASDLLSKAQSLLGF